MTYELFETWIKEVYSPADLELHYDQEYKTIQQYENESIDAFRLRFDEAANKLLELPKRITWHFLSALNEKCGGIAYQFFDFTNKKITVTQVT